MSFPMKIGYGKLSPFQEAKKTFGGECHPTNQLLMLEKLVEGLENLIREMVKQSEATQKKLGRPRKDAGI